MRTPLLTAHTRAADLKGGCAIVSHAHVVTVSRCAAAGWLTHTVRERARGRTGRLVQAQFRGDLIGKGELQRSAVNVHEQEVDSLEEITDISARISGASRRAILVPWRHQLEGCDQQAAAFDQQGRFPLERGDRNFLVGLLGRVVR